MINKQVIEHNVKAKMYDTVENNYNKGIAARMIGRYYNILFNTLTSHIMYNIAFTYD